MHIIDWILVPPILVGAVYYVVRVVFRPSRGKKACECSGCGEAGTCAEKERNLT